MDYYLTFPSESTSLDILVDLEEYSVDVIGEIDIFPNQYLVNLRGPETDRFDLYKVIPPIPYRTWA